MKKGWYRDNKIIPNGVEDWRQKDADVNWLFDTISKLDLLITPQTGPCFIAAGFRIPMWVYRSNHINWDNILNYDYIFILSIFFSISI
jgi:hypothetical protein